GRVQGDDRGMSIKDVGGILFGYAYERFDWRTAGLSQLRNRAIDRRYVEADRVADLREEELRDLIAQKETFDLAGASREGLLRQVDKLGVESRRRAVRLEEDELRRLIRAARDARPLGMITNEATVFGVEW